MWVFFCFNFERNYGVWNPKSPCILLNKNINVNKNETEPKTENPSYSFRQTNLCFNSRRNQRTKIKVRLWWCGAYKRKKRAFFVRFILPEGSFFNICVLSQCIVHWLHLQNIHAFTYQKTLLHSLFYLFLKSSNAFVYP